MTTRWRTLAIVAAMLAGMAVAQAAPPTFRITQAFTSVDGRYQVVELTESAGLDGQHRWAGLALTMANGDRVRTVVFPADLPSEKTARMSVVVTMLYADDDGSYFTAVYGNGANAVYYALPPQYLDVRGGRLDFAGADAWTFPALPRDGVNALYRDGSVATATMPVGCDTAPCARQEVLEPRAYVSEFYHAGANAYVLTVDALEIEALSAGRVPGWRPSTESFGVLSSPRPPYDAPVCRFFTPGGGHFLTAFAHECDALAAAGNGFILESPAVFYVALPDPATGACADGIPIYRYWNSANGADHRYTQYGKTLDTSLSILRGYVREGYGPDGVGFCAVGYTDGWDW
jgi:hypothetical protein